MTEEKYKIWDTWIKLVGVSLTIITLIIGVVQYGISNGREFRKKVYDEQLKTYTEFIEVCSKLSNWNKKKIDSSDSFRKDYLEFEKIYYGKLRLTQTDKIDSIATSFFLKIKQFKNPTSNISNTDLQRTVDAFVNESKKSLKNTWERDISELH